MPLEPRDMPTAEQIQPTPPTGAQPPLHVARLSQIQADELADALGESTVNEIYMYMFYRRSCGAEEMREAGFDAAAVSSALSVLAARGLITPAEEGQWIIVPPSRAFPPLAARLEERAQFLRTSLPGLSAAYHSTRGGGDENAQLHGIEYLPTASDIVFAMTQCYAQAESRVRVMMRDSIATRKATFDAFPSLREGKVGVAPRNLDCVTVLHTPLVRNMAPEDLDWFENSPHETLLLSGKVPITVVASDNGMAVVESSVGGLTEGLLITHPQLSKAFYDVVDIVVENSSVWDRSGESTERPDVLSAAEQEILHMLSLGIPDATIARRLQISSRTFDRRLRSIMDALGAATRFQAGAIASRRGWL